MKGDDMWAWAEAHGALYPAHKGQPQYGCSAILKDGTQLPAFC